MGERVAIVVGAGGDLGLVTAGVDRSEEAMKQLPDGIAARRPTRSTRPRPAASSTGSLPRSVRRRCW
jgi:hypothetical protein